MGSVRKKYDTMSSIVGHMLYFNARIGLYTGWFPNAPVISIY
jgi:hypothetical protein